MFWAKGSGWRKGRTRAVRRAGLARESHQGKGLGEGRMVPQRLFPRAGKQVQSADQGLLCNVKSPLAWMAQASM